jgi:spore maturation protein SpmB
MSSARAMRFPLGLIADAVGVLASVTICRLVFA